MDNNWYFLLLPEHDAISEIKCEMRRGKWPSVARARGEVRWVYNKSKPHGYLTVTARGVYVYTTYSQWVKMFRPNGVLLYNICRLRRS